MIGKLLVESLLQIWCAHLVSHMSVGLMTKEKLAFASHCKGDVLSSFDILLRAIHHANVASSQRQQLIFENVTRICSLIHQIQLSDDTDRADSLWVDLLRQLQSVRVCQIRVGGCDGENQTCFLLDELENHLLDLVLNVNRLIADGDFRETRQIDEG